MLATAIFQGEKVQVIEEVYITATNSVDVLINYGGARWVHRDDLTQIVYLPLGV